MGSMCVERATKEISFSHFHFSLFSPGPLTKVSSLGRDRGYNTVCKVNATLFLFFFMFTVVFTTCHPFDKNKKNIQHHNNTKQYKLKNKNTNARRRKLQESKCSVGRQKINHTRRRFRRIARMNPIPVRYKGRSPGFWNVIIALVCVLVFSLEGTQGGKERMAGRDFKGTVFYFNVFKCFGRPSSQ